VAVKLRLMRMGKKKQPTYRVVAADARSPRNGRFIEIVGVYDPRPDPSAVRIDNDKALGWLRKGAQPTESVRKLLEISGAWEEFSGEPRTRPVLTPAAEATPAPAPAPAAKAAAKPAQAKPKATEPEAAATPVEAEPEAVAPEAAATADAPGADASDADAAPAAPAEGSE
jgi:small subunit ribosomal protein S16